MSCVHLYMWRIAHVRLCPSFTARENWTQPCCPTDKLALAILCAWINVQSIPFPAPAHVWVVTVPRWTVMHGSVVCVCVCYLMRVCTHFLPCVKTECIHVAGLPLLSTSEGILHCTATLYHHRLSGIHAGVWGGWWWVDGYHSQMATIGF